MTLHIDFESRSTVDLKKTGAYVYAADPTTDMWCAAYAFGEGPIKVWTPGQPCPPEIAEHVMLGGTATAHNAAFERIIWKYILTPRYGWPEPETEQWRCTMTMAYAMAMPGSLENAAPAAGLDMMKDMVGRRLMLQMAKPRKLTERPCEECEGGVRQKRDGYFCPICDGDGVDRTVTWWDDPAKVEKLIDYCKQDVEVERALEKRLRPLSASELALWHLDQKINDRGVLVDESLCHAAKAIVGEAQKALDKKMRQLTDSAVSACSNRNQLVKWVKDQGVECDSVAKAAMEELLAEDSPVPPHVRDVLLVRQEAAKASVAKIDALLNGKSPEDNRAKGLLQFHAATTGRWGGRRFQPQNLVRPEHVESIIGLLIDSILAGDSDMIDMLGIPYLTAVAQTLRGMLIAEDGKRIVAADYSNIEGRVLAWLAGEEWKLQAFRDFDAGTGHDLYKITAGGILHKRPEDVTKDERQSHGKVPELALGYQGGVGAFSTMAANYGVDLERGVIEAIRDGWREKHPKIKAFWYAVENAAVEAVRARGSVQSVGRIRLKVAGSFLMMRLPSGRFLAYPYPEIRWFKVPWFKNEPEWVDCESEDAAVAEHGERLICFDEANKRALVRVNQIKEGLTYFSTIDVSKKAKVVEDRKNSSTWARIKTYGGMLVENATQAVARDVMASAMPRLEAAGYPIILTVHDEIVTEPEIGHGSVEEMEEIMCDLPEWARGLPVAAEGFSGSRYRK